MAAPSRSLTGRAASRCEGRDLDADTPHLRRFRIGVRVRASDGSFAEPCHVGNLGGAGGFRRSERTHRSSTACTGSPV
jgi:hypothetical protein